MDHEPCKRTGRSRRPRVDQSRRDQKVKVATFSLSASSPTVTTRRTSSGTSSTTCPSSTRSPVCSSRTAGRRRRSAGPRARCSRRASSRRTTSCTTCSANRSRRRSTSGSRSARTSHQVGRFPHRLPAVMLAVGDLVAGHAAPSALVTAEVVPYRPNRGMYLVVELPDDTSEPPAWAPEHVERAARHRRRRRHVDVHREHAATRSLRPQRLQHHGLLPRRRPGRGRETDRRGVRRPLGAHRPSPPSSPRRS